MVVFNRFSADTDEMALHKLVRGVSRRANIIYEDINGVKENDNIEDSLPFDINAPVIEIDDKDFAVWYRDLAEDGAIYNGKIVKFKAIIAIDERIPSNVFVAGRHVMTCCADDIEYRGLACKGGRTKEMKSRDWLMITGKSKNEYCSIYDEKGPVVKVFEVQKAEKPVEEVATFY